MMPFDVIQNRLDYYECFLVEGSELGDIHRGLHGVAQKALNIEDTALATKVLDILETEIRNFIFLDYLKNEHKEEIQARLKKWSEEETTTEVDPLDVLFNSE